MGAPASNAPRADETKSSEKTKCCAASSTPQITLYTSAVCGYCVAAKNFLKSRGLEWNEVRIDTDPAEREKMVALARRTSVPQIFVGDQHVGGYEDRMALHRAGKFEPLMSGEHGWGGGRGPDGARRIRQNKRVWLGRQRGVQG